MSITTHFWKYLRLPALLAAASVVLASCATIDDPAQFRRDHIKAYQEDLQKQQVILDHPLTLPECIGIAMRQNLDARQAELKKELAKVDRSTAFAAFLPRVTLSSKLTTWSIANTAGGNQTSDKTYLKHNLDGDLPLIVPAAYFLFENAKLGVHAAELSVHFTRQAIILETGIAFFRTCLTEKLIAALETQTEAARQLQDRVTGLAEQGLTSAWEGKQATYLYEARKAALENSRRQLAADKGELLKLLGLSPLADLKLNPTFEMDALPDLSLEDFVFLALQQHPSLAIADLQTVAAENNVRSALANFLPNLSAFVNSSWTSDSFAAHAGTLSGGFAVAMDLFKGFQKVNAYKSSKINRLASQLDREATTLSVMLEVVKSYNTLQDAQTNLTTTRTAADYLNAKYKDYAARQKEGLLPVNEVLDAQGDAQTAETDHLKAVYQVFLARIQFDMATGSLVIPDEEPSKFFIKAEPVTAVMAPAAEPQPAKAIATPQPASPAKSAVPLAPDNEPPATEQADKPQQH